MGCVRVNVCKYELGGLRCVLAIVFMILWFKIAENNSIMRVKRSTFLVSVVSLSHANNVISYYCMPLQVELCINVN